MSDKTQKSWTIGSLDDCDIVIDEPTISGQHCRLTLVDRGYRVEDLKSTNGTFVNGVSIEEPRVVARGDQLRLGQSVQFSWDLIPEASRFEITIGRAEDNDVVIDSTVVSSKHARLVIDGNEITLEDFDTTNGTAVDHPSNKINAERVSLHTRVYMGTYETRMDNLIQQAAEKNEAVARWLETHIASATFNAANRKRTLIEVAVAVIVFGGLAIWSMYALNSNENGPLAKNTDQPSSQGASSADNTGPSETDNKSTNEPDKTSKPNTDSDRSVVAIEKKVNGKKTNPDPNDVTLTGSENGLYSVVIRSKSDGLAFQVGTAWAVSPSCLVTSAEVVHAIEQTQNDSAIEVYWGDGDHLGIREMEVHPSYLAAEQTANSAYQQYQNLMKQQAENPNSIPQNEFDRQVSDLNRQFHQAGERMVYFDIAVLRVELLPKTMIRKTLPIGEMPVNRIKGRDVRVTGNAYPLQEGIEFDPDNIELAELSGEFFLSTQNEHDDVTDNKDAVFVVHVECAPSATQPLQENNWMGSPALDKNDRVVGVFSRVADPNQTGNLNSSDAGAEQARRIFVMSTIDRLQDFESLKEVIFHE